MANLNQLRSEAVVQDCVLQRKVLVDQLSFVLRVMLHARLGHGRN